jgi:hypothetical protein
MGPHGVAHFRYGNNNAIRKLLTISVFWNLRNCELHNFAKFATRQSGDVDEVSLKGRSLGDVQF